MTNTLAKIAAKRRLSECFLVLSERSFKKLKRVGFIFGMGFYLIFSAIGGPASGGNFFNILSMCFVFRPWRVIWRCGLPKADEWKINYSEIFLTDQRDWPDINER